MQGCGYCAAFSCLRQVYTLQGYQDAGKICISSYPTFYLPHSQTQARLATMAHVNTALTWSLDSTASTTISVFKDVMRAATSDNVQPLALMACEKFGATLAMCPETNKKMEDLIIKVSGPKYVRFMSAQIGYSANDSATQLSRSLAGVQFLGLAAALVSSVDMFQGANALSVMLMDSASDKTLLPTARQLKDLLRVIEHRLNRSSFADVWVGYQILLSGGLNASLEQDRLGRPRSGQRRCTPEVDGIWKLVEAFRQLNRLGNAIAITIRTTSCASWVMAFTRWCLGLPPSTILPNGKALLDQPASRITLFTDYDESTTGFEISIQRSIGSPTDLLRLEWDGQSTKRNHAGMITVECFGQLKCQQMGGEGSLAYRAMCEALPYALKQSCELLQPMARITDFTKAGSEEAERASETQMLARIPSEHLSKPFPEDFIISSVLTRVLNSKSQQNLQRLDEGQLITDLPLVHLYLRDLAEFCVCIRCRNQPPSGTYRITCEKDVFLSNISRYAADILVLSIFESPEMLLVSLPNGHHDASCIFLKAVHYIIESGKPASCAVRKILGRALTLVGHTDFDEKRWVVSCYKGQTVYPSVFETRDICQPGYLMLCWAPGLLFFDGEVYNKGIDTSYHYLKEYRDTTDSVSIQPSRPVVEPLNLVPDMRMEWKVVCCDGYLDVYLVCGGFIGRPSRVLMNLSRALILRGCPHNSATPLDRPDPFSSYLGPSLPSQGLHNNPRAPRSSGAGRRIGVVAVEGNAGLRMFAVSVLDPTRPEFPFVIRKGACLQCCLDLCRRAESDYLIC